MQEKSKQLAPLEARFLLQAELGRGGFGTVWKALQKSTGQHVAIKMLHLRKADTPDEAARQQRILEREMEAIARLDSPHVVRLYDSGVTPSGDPYLVLELVRGLTLRQLLGQGPLAPDPALRIMKQVTEAVADAHELGIVHCDLKPENVIVGARGGRLGAKILDFGVAVLTEESRAADGVEQHSVGTPFYLAPELIGGLRGAKPASDVYALGLVFGEMLTGQKMVSGESIVKVLANQLAVPVEIPEELQWSELGSIIEKATAKDPAARFPDAGALLHVLEKIDPAMVPPLPGAQSVEALAATIEAEALFEDIEAPFDIPVSDDGPAVPMSAPVTIPASTRIEAAHVLRQEPPRKKRWLWVALPVALLLVVLPLAFALRSGDESTPSSPDTSAERPPTEVGAGTSHVDKPTAPPPPREDQAEPHKVAEPKHESAPLTDDELAIDKLLGEARTAARDGQLETAIGLYEEVLQKDPQRDKAREELGWLLLGLKRFQDAVVQFATLAERGVESENVVLALALAQEGAGDLSAARRGFQRFIELYPESRRAEDVQARLAVIPEREPDDVEPPPLDETATVDGASEHKSRRDRRRSKVKRIEVFK